MFKRTKIIATLGPACARPEIISQMITAGVDVFRLNMSHGDQATHGINMAMVRAAGVAARRPIGVLADLQGPKIRTGKLKGGGPVEWKDGARTIITIAPWPEGTADKVQTIYAGLVKDVKAGDALLVDDGKMRLRVEKIDGDDIHCLIEAGGLLKNSKGINLPGVRVSAPPLSEKDLSDLAWACGQKVDFVALSFVHCADDIIDLKRRMAELGYVAAVVAKIELPEAVDDIEAISRESEAIMVARGDLGIEIGPEWLPMVQKDLIRAVNRHGRVVITATQMLESMIELPMPTRAETTDVANAIIDGSDAVMLSGETASGKYPLEAVATMARLAVVAERSSYLVRVQPDRTREEGFPQELGALGRAAIMLSEERRAAAVVVADGDPRLVRLLCEGRGRAPILVCCKDEAEARRLILYWGVFPLVGTGDNSVTSLVDLARSMNLLESGDEVLVVHRKPQDSITMLRFW